MVNFGAVGLVKEETSKKFWKLYFVEIFAVQSGLQPKCRRQKVSGPGNRIKIENLQFQKIQQETATTEGDEQ